MLRRKPTAITLTTEDIAIYEDARAREASERISKEENKERQLCQNHMLRDPNPLLTNQQAHRQFPHDNIKEPTTQERILGQGSHSRH
ncbi:hypothetical protein OnM2_048032 [Erysiphe neolycopersici]|uniref:Anaphase-promoting complex, subunit CDC26 n=1 Tax=Erysiphe neolycopersici TaxID=212602 RepID=A0A420HT99_9PEZI|nr:hypothetical protein OnM2_048032 [Erysiphe neolycopersici]